LNAQIRRKPFPLPKISDLLRKLSGFNYDTAIVLSMGYYHIPLDLEAQKLCTTVNPSGKASAKIPQLPLGDNSSPWGDNAICTGAHTGYTAGSAKSLSATYQYKISNKSDKSLANKNLTSN
jgi:hypothetical protein